MMTMLDFSSALYLGFRHESRTLQAWTELTKGVPSAINSPSGERYIAGRLADLQGCEGGLLAPSTLHLFWDLFGIMSRFKMTIFMDEGVYPIAKWCADRAIARGIPIQSFHHHDPDALQKQIKQCLTHNTNPLVIFNGFCPGCGKSAPISTYLKIIRNFEGYMLIDDTQALGIFGYSPTPENPYGIGGGGSLRRGNVKADEVLMISSLAKGFGVPMSVLSGSHKMIKLFEKNSDTRVHCSPPSTAVIHAAKNAIGINRKRGDSLRLRLAYLVQRFRSGLARKGLYTVGGLFPVQTLKLSPNHDAKRIHERLLSLQIRTVLNRGRIGKEARLSFIINARHSASDIDCAIDSLTYVIKERYVNVLRSPQSYKQKSAYI